MQSYSVEARSSVEVAAADEQASDSPFSCNVCKKSYTRIDHLARHFRSHSRERPFVCETCGKTFARIDLLKRHIATHTENEDGGDDGTAGRINKRRRTLPNAHRPRALKACRACAESKLRCEGSDPCLRCQQKSLVCEYTQARSLGPQEPPSPTFAPPTGHLQPGSAVHNRQPSAPSSVIEQPSTSNADPMMGGSNTERPLQLPTPSPFGQYTINNAPHDAHDLTAHFEDIPILESLRDIPFSSNDIGDVSNFFDDDFPRDVLDFGADLNFTTPSIFNNELDLLIEQQFPPSIFTSRDLEQPMSRSGIATPGLRGSLNITASAQAFKESLWLWTPEKDDHGALEQANLSLPWDSIASDDQFHSYSLPPDQQVSNMTRGKVLAMVLRTCEAAVHSHVISNFPSPGMITKLVQNFITFHSQQDVSWIHPATIFPDRESPEFIASIVSFGAAISPVLEIRKLGFAMQEAVRMAAPYEFERDNRATRQLRPLQTFCLYLDVGFWSGNRRKMEIAESFALPLVTMIRRAGYCRYKKIFELPPQQEDIGSDLEAKWHTWVQQESFKRLALYLLYRDARSSMSVLSQPLISYGEVAVALPCTKELWLAKTALEWKTIYLANQNDAKIQPPSIRSCMDDSTPIYEYRNILDVDLSLLLIISSVWPLIWQYREMKNAARFRSTQDARHSTLTMTSRHHEVVQLLQHIQLNSTEWGGGMKPASWLLHEQCLLHLYVSLEDVQLLAGKEGEEEARRVFPALNDWAQSSEARNALFHAGQVIRAAKGYRKFLLRDASAVAVYHASLVFWAYAVLCKTNNRIDLTQAFSGAENLGKSSKMVRLDGEDNPEVQRFLRLGRGVPCIQQQIEGAESTSTREIPLNESTEVMLAITDILQKSCEAGEKGYPPLLDNLGRLMRSLGKAAVKKGQR